MYRTVKSINSIKFPVYSIPSTDWYTQDGILFLEGKAIDDKNMPGTTLGIRRLQCQRSDLLKLKKAYLDYVAMLSSKKTIFIDSNGIPFKYIRTKTCPLKYHKINNIEKKDNCTILWLEGVNTPFTIARPPYGDARYARVLYLDKIPWLLYDFSTIRGRDSHRRV